MARILVTCDGRTDSNGAPIVCHNERLADPLDPFTLAIATLTSKTKKAEADHIEIARIEHAGGMYHDGADAWLREHMGSKMPSIEHFVGDLDLQPDLGPYIPGWNLLRCLQEAGKRHKLGKQVLMGLTPVTMKVPLQYEGPRQVDELWFDGSFALRKSIGISGRRTMRTRPLWTDWTLEAEFELDLTILNPEKINQLAREAGRYVGLCEMRPIYGRFEGSAEVAMPAPKTKAAKEKVLA